MLLKTTEKGKEEEEGATTSLPTAEEFSIDAAG